MAFVEVAADGAGPSAMWVIGILMGALSGSGLIIAKLATALWNERLLRIQDREAIIEKLDEERTARDATRAMRERERKGP